MNELESAERILNRIHNEELDRDTLKHLCTEMFQLGKHYACYHMIEYLQGSVIDGLPRLPEKKRVAAKNLGQANQKKA